VLQVPPAGAGLGPGPRLALPVAWERVPGQPRAAAGGLTGALWPQRAEPLPVSALKGHDSEGLQSGDRTGLTVQGSRRPAGGWLAVTGRPRAPGCRSASGVPAGLAFPRTASAIKCQPGSSLGPNFNEPSRHRQPGAQHTAPAACYLRQTVTI
jgi:hypothetical protein